MTQTRTLTGHTTEINTIMCTALIVKQAYCGWLLIYVIQKERCMLCHRTEIPPGAGLSVLITLPAFWLWSAVPETLHLLWYTPRLHLNLKQPAPVQLCLGRCYTALVKVHVRLVFCSFWGGVACALGCSLVSSVFLGFLLSIDRTVLLCRRFLLGNLYLGLGLGHNGVTSREQLLEKDTKNTTWSIKLIQSNRLLLRGNIWI